MPWTTSWLRSPNHPERLARTSSTAPSAGSKPPAAWHFNVSPLRLFWNPLTAYPADAIRFTLCFRAIEAQRIGHLIGGLTSPALVQSSREPCPHDLSSFAPAARHSRTGHAESKGPFSHRKYKSRLLISKGGGPAGNSSFECHRPTATNAGPGGIAGNWRLQPELHPVRETGSEATVWGEFRRRSLLCPPSP